MSYIAVERSYLVEIDMEIAFFIAGNLGYPDLLRMRMLSKHFRDFVDNYPLMNEVKVSAITLYKELQAEIRTAYKKQDLDGMRSCLERGVSPNISELYNVRLVLENIFSYLCVDGNDEAIKLFLEYGANINVQRKYDNDNWTPLLLACNEGNVSTVRILIENSADVNLADRDGLTPLMIAAVAGKIEIIKTLLESGADPLALDKDGYDVESHISRVRMHRVDGGYPNKPMNVHRDIISYILHNASVK